MVTSITFIMIIVLLSFWHVERGTLQTSRMWMAIRYASDVDMLPIDNGGGHEK